MFFLYLNVYNDDKTDTAVTPITFNSLQRLDFILCTELSEQSLDRIVVTFLPTREIEKDIEKDIETESHQLTSL